MKRTFTFFLLWLCGLLCGVQTASAATWYVATNGSDSNPGTQAAPFFHIQVGINHAQNGDTVVVANGTYRGDGNVNLDFLGRIITLQSQGGAANCIIDCENNGRGIQFHSGETTIAAMDGFTITNGRITETVGGGAGGAIDFDGGSATIRNCILTRNVVSTNSTNAGGGAVFIRDANPVFINCTLSDNQVTSASANASSGGMMIQTGSATLTNCNLVGNLVSASGDFATAVGGGIAALPGSAATLTDCTLSDNIVSALLGFAIGGGGYSKNATCTLNHCTLASNALYGRDNAGPGGGGLYSETSTTVVSGCIFRNNTATGGYPAGGGAWFALAHTNSRVVNSIFYGNRLNGFASGGALMCTGSPSPGAPLILPITNCVFVDNSAVDVTNDPDRSGAVNFAYQANCTMTNCIVYRNLPAGQEIRRSGSNVTITYCNIQGYPANTDANHNFGLAPEFFNEAAGDFHLRFNSPCLDNGTAAAPALPATDFDGNLRISGFAPDIGAYEFDFDHALFVDPILGVDQPNAGRAGFPCKTVSFAHSQIPSGSPASWTIYVKGYNSPERAGNGQSLLPLPIGMVNKKVKVVNWGNTGVAAIGKQQ